MLEYRDAYLKRFATEAIETLAQTNVDRFGTFDDAWRDPLTVLQAYIIICLENQADPEDLFSDKYEKYSREFKGLLAQARTATPDDEGNVPAVFSVDLERA